MEMEGVLTEITEIGPLAYLLPIAGRGDALVRATRDAMALLDEMDDQTVNQLPLGLEDDSLGREVLVWIEAMTCAKHLLSDQIIAERSQYYRALFNLSTDKRTRLRLVDNLDAMFCI